MSTFQYGDRSMKFAEDGKSFTVNSQVEGSPALITSPRVCVGFANGFMDAFRFELYHQLELGLHLGGSTRPGGPRSIEDIKRVGFVNNVGYLTPDYVGNDPQLLRLRPEVGVVTLGYMGQWVRENFVGQPYVGPKEDPAWDKWASKANSVYFKHLAIDALLKGGKFVLAPHFNVENEAGEFHRDVQHVEGWVRTYLESAMATNEAALAVRKDKLESKLLNKTVAKNYAAAETGTLPEISEVATTGGEITGLEGFVGHQVAFVNKMGKEIGGFRRATAENIAVLANSAKQRGLSLAIVNAG